MSDNDEFSPAIDRMVSEINRLDNEAAELKRTVNKLCGFAGRDKMYTNIDQHRSPDVGRSQFFGAPFASAVKAYLSLRGDPRKNGLGAATVNEIHAGLTQGGYVFETKNEDHQKRNIYVSLRKNTSAFTNVGGAGADAYGLREWYQM
jgi:hypothetical protein